MFFQENARRRVSVMEKSTAHLTKEQFFVDENCSEVADKGTIYKTKY